MAITRDNHFVPQWHQRGFLEPGRSTLAYLDLAPPTKVLADGRVVDHMDAPTAERVLERMKAFGG